MSGKVIFQCQTVFPFTLFPTTVEVTPTRVNIEYGVFFLSHRRVSILIVDLVNAVVSTNIFFGTLQLEIRYFESNPAPVRFLPKNDAVKLRQIITGLIEAKDKNIQLGKLTPKRKKDLRKIGKSKSF